MLMSVLDERRERVNKSYDDFIEDFPLFKLEDEVESYDLTNILNYGYVVGEESLALFDIDNNIKDVDSKISCRAKMKIGTGYSIKEFKGTSSEGYVKEKWVVVTLRQISPEYNLSDLIEMSFYGVRVRNNKVVVLQRLDSKTLFHKLYEIFVQFEIWGSVSLNFTAPDFFNQATKALKVFKHRFNGSVEHKMLNDLSKFILDKYHEHYDIEDVFYIRETFVTDKAGWRAKLAMSERELAYKSFQEDNEIWDRDEWEFYEICKGSKQVGYFSIFDRNGEKILVGINILPEYQNEGYGKQTIQKLIDTFNQLTLYTTSPAVVKICADLNFRVTDVNSYGSAEEDLELKFDVRQIKNTSFLVAEKAHSRFKKVFGHVEDFDYLCITEDYLRS